MHPFENATRILFFTGKGGVGKTSLACATALQLAAEGQRVLLVSTDPASNLDEVLGVRLSQVPTEVPGASGLFALNIDPEAAARAYRERVVGPYRGVLPEAAVNSMEEQLSGACTVEIAAFDEFTKLLGDSQATAGFDHIVFDTAPTGHTLRLLKLPAAWTGFIATNTTGTSCLGPLSGLDTQKSLYEASLAALVDAAITTIVLVSRPDRASLTEAERSRLELEEMGITNQILFLNGVFRAQDVSDPSARALEQLGRRALEEMPAALAGLRRVEIPLLARAPMGVAGLASMFGGADQGLDFGAVKVTPTEGALTLAELIDDLERGGRGVIMTMGKGGVGKTTMAAAIAVELAARGHRVHLSTTDPAAHVAAAVESAPAGLTVSRIDPARETREYSEQVMAKAAAGLDEQGRALLEEDLRSPCTEEIAVFSAFARTVAGGENGFVVLDTAPTGHTILLLDAAQAYHRDVTRNVSDVPESVRCLLPRLRDPQFTRILLVTLPEATPVHEASRLQSDLERAGIHPYAWIINQSFSGEGFRDPLLVARGMCEEQYVREVKERSASRFAIVPWRLNPPVGVDNLRQLVTGELCQAG
jgi:arsenite/tail-anchored protein-transporting ATPase